MIDRSGGSIGTDEISTNRVPNPDASSSTGDSLSIDRPQRNPPAHSEVASHFWLTRADETILAILASILLLLLAMYWVRLTHWGTATVEIEHVDPHAIAYHLDVNSATWIEWTQLEGIGDGLARRIVAEREQNGPFRSVDDLRRVKGIGPKTLERLRPWVRIAAESNDSPAVGEKMAQQHR